MRCCRFMGVLLSLLACAAMLRAQSDDGAQPGYTLHVYANLVQVPTLVLTNTGEPVTKLTREKFDIRLDEGPAFKPVKIRPEGDDAVSLAILIDATGDERTLFEPLTRAFAQLPAGAGLKPHDRVFLYAVDCQLLRSRDEMHADGAGIADSLHALLAVPALHNGKGKPACGNSVHLWDSLAKVALDLSEQPGRHVVLALTEGLDHGSHVELSDLIHYLCGHSIAVFGMRDRANGPGEAGAMPLNGDRRNVAGLMPMHFMTMRTGGIIFNVVPSSVSRNVRDLFTDIRARYILEFPRPDNGAPGNHSIMVEVPSLAQPVVRPAGVSTSMPDPAVLNDPTTVPSAKSPAVYGNRRPLK